MNTDSLHFALNSVSNIINNNLNKKYYKQQIFDIQKVIILISYNPNDFLN